MIRVLLLLLILCLPSCTLESKAHTACYLCVHRCGHVAECMSACADVFLAENSCKEPEDADAH